MKKKSKLTGKNKVDKVLAKAKHLELKDLQPYEYSETDEKLAKSQA